MTLFEIEVKKNDFINLSQFLDNKFSITLKTFEKNKVWICGKRNYLCAIALKCDLLKGLFFRNFITEKCVKVSLTSFDYVLFPLMNSSVII